MRQTEERLLTCDRRLGDAERTLAERPCRRWIIRAHSAGVAAAVTADSSWRSRRRWRPPTRAPLPFGPGGLQGVCVSVTYQHPIFRSARLYGRRRSPLRRIVLT